MDSCDTMVAQAAQKLSSAPTFSFFRSRKLISFIKNLNQSSTYESCELTSHLLTIFNGGKTRFRHK